VVFLNGVPQNEPYATLPHGEPGTPDAYTPFRDDFPADLEGIESAASSNHAAYWAVDLQTHLQRGDIVVPPGTVFAMGDHRTQSLDSRYWGFVPDENIMGRPMFVYWSFKTPEDEEDKTSMGDRIAFAFHVVTHIFGGTRWSRTLHVIR
jgi:signal peptidase I